MKKDNIEKLFSSLEDFSKTPPDDLWQGIEEKLDNSKTKKRFPFWWSIAATLVVGLGLLATFYSHPDTNSITIPDESKNGVVNQSGSTNAQEKENVANEAEAAKNDLDKPFSNSNATVETKTQEPVTNAKSSVINLNNRKITNSNTAAVAVITNQNTVVSANKNETIPQSKEIKSAEKVVLTQPNPIAEQNKKIVEKLAVDDKIKEKSATITIEEKENALAAIEKELQKKDKTVSTTDKWSLQLFAGINNSQNIKNQKSLGNTIESQRGHSYGVKTNYKLNRRWAVSTGLKVSELGQQLANVSYVNSAKSLVSIAKEPMSAPQLKGSIVANTNYLFIPKTADNSKNVLSSNNFYETGNLSQRVQYLEMPIEISYSILNKGKTHINMNTGGFVGKAISNKVLLDNSSIGENQDINEVVFGTVLSSTLQYELFKKTKVFVEPGMNYYTQPAQNQNFNQFQLIFNFGLNVSF